MYYLFVRRGHECFQISFRAICISKQVCGNVGAFVYSVHKGVFTASSHSLSLLDFREIHLKKGRFSLAGGKRVTSSFDKFRSSSNRASFMSLPQSHGDGPTGCAVWSHRSEPAQIQSPCATASLHA